MFARLSAFVIWSLVAATAVFWVLRLSASPPAVPPYALAVGNAAAVRGDLSRLFGAPQRAAALAQATPEAPSRFKLLGVMAPRSSTAQAEVGHGLALIAVDGKPAKAYAVGARLDSDLVLQSVGLRTAALGPAQGARSVLLELPALPAPQTGVMPPPGMAATAPVPAPVPTAAPTRMQAAQAAAQAAMAAQAGQGAAAQGTAPGAGQAPGQALGVPQAPFVPPPIVPSPSVAPPTPNLPTPGGLPTQ